jgi:hypothetical protein
MNSRYKDRRGQRGQTTLLIVMVVSIFLLGFIALAVDFSNLWFHRQSAQAAADSACQAAALDVFLWSQGAATGSAGFTPTAGGNFLCSGSLTAAPCKYAEFNGYKATTGGLQTDAESTEVQVSFPASIPNVTTPPATLTGGVPFVRVDVTDRARVFFATLFTGKRTQDVVASAGCGLQNVQAPIPLIVLHPTLASALDVQGTPDIIIQGGPKKSIQVNSNNSAAVHVQGSASIDLSTGGPSFSGSDLGVWGGPSSAPGGFVPGTTGHWRSPAPIISDPFATLPVPTAAQIAALPTDPAPNTVAYHVNGCPDTNGCYEYVPGNYTNGICVGKGGCSFKTKTTAIFDAGLYVMGDQLKIGSNSDVRPSTVDNSASQTWSGGVAWGGTTFYFNTASPLSVAANAGSNTSLDALGANLPSSPAVQCASGTALDLTKLPSTYTGNILLGPCAGPYGDPLGQFRGTLFFGARNLASSANWGGGGSFLLAGNMYFHQCKANGTGTAPCSAPGAGGFGTTMSLQGGSGSSSYVLGEIVTDVLTLGGNSTIHMNLNPAAQYNIVLVQLLQ